MLMHAGHAVSSRSAAKYTEHYVKIMAPLQSAASGMLWRSVPPLEPHSCGLCSWITMRGWSVAQTHLPDTLEGLL